jgi:hypothetical protein
MEKAGTARVEGGVGGMGLRLCGIGLPALLFANCLVMRAQALLVGPDAGGAVRLLSTDWAVLETQEPRKDLPCSLDPVKPAVGFDLRFHAGYGVTVPLKELAGSENRLTMLFRVTAESQKTRPFYFVQHVRVPSIAPDAAGNAHLEGAFDLGEGRYHVDWLMRDRSDRVCSSYWDTEAALPAKDKSLTLVQAPGTVSAAETETFKAEPPVERTHEQPLSVKVLVNFSPQNPDSIAFPQDEMATLVSILRDIDREPRIGRFCVIAFNLREERVLYRQDYEGQIDFPALGKALGTLKLGTVDLKRLAEKNGETEFLTNLIQQEVGKDEHHPDALVFAGPKALVEESVPRDTLEDVGEVEYPVFYLNYNLHPQDVPWRDAIGRAVKYFRGYEFTITRPRDLGAAMTDMVARIVRLRDIRKTASLASQ